VGDKEKNEDQRIKAGGADFPSGRRCFFIRTGGVGGKVAGSRGGLDNQKKVAEISIQSWASSRRSGKKFPAGAAMSDKESPMKGWEFNPD